MKSKFYMYLSVFIRITLIDRSKYIYIIYVICIYRDVYFNERYSNTIIYSRVSRFPKVYHCYISGHEKRILYSFFRIDIKCYHVLGSWIAKAKSSPAWFYCVGSFLCVGKRVKAITLRCTIFSASVSPRNLFKSSTRSHHFNRRKIRVPIR